MYKFLPPGIPTNGDGDGMKQNHYEARVYVKAVFEDSTYLADWAKVETKGADDGLTDRLIRGCVQYIEVKRDEWKAEKAVYRIDVHFHAVYRNGRKADRSAAIQGKSLIELVDLVVSDVKPKIEELAAIGAAYAGRQAA